MSLPLRSKNPSLFSQKGTIPIHHLFDVTSSTVNHCLTFVRKSTADVSHCCPSSSTTTKRIDLSSTWFEDNVFVTTPTRKSLSRNINQTRWSALVSRELRACKQNRIEEKSLPCFFILSLCEQSRDQSFGAVVARVSTRGCWAMTASISYLSRCVLIKPFSRHYDQGKYPRHLTHASSFCGFVLFRLHKNLCLVRID